MFKTLTAVVAAMALIGSPALAASHDSSGEVVKIDKPAGKITMKHGPIKKLDMDSMTMVFRVADPAMLDAVKAGDRVRFEADRVNGAITIITMDKVK
ncbi:MAG: copper-binding protein [Rhodospirillaceae bacterium]|nr:copper-binding protein [Rhodospirillaceae bacterium]